LALFWHYFGPQGTILTPSGTGIGGRNFLSFLSVKPEILVIFWTQNSA
jgi:hypothetical protein